MKSFRFLTMLMTACAMAFTLFACGDDEITPDQPGNTEQTENKPAVPKNCIFYTSTDGNEVTPTWPNQFGANIISNSCQNGKGTITFGGVVTKIGDEAFSNCKRLKTVRIPNAVTEIGIYAFHQCSNLTEVEMPNSVTEIDNMAFWACTSLTEVEIPNSVEEIGRSAFADCPSLSKFTGKFASDDHRCLIKDGVMLAFAPAGLTSYTIPSSVTKIGREALNSCTSLTSVVIPKSVTEIGWYAFAGCTSLTEITCLAVTPPTLGESAFVKINEDCTLKVPKESIAAYQAIEAYRFSFKNIVGI